MLQVMPHTADSYRSAAAQHLPAALLRLHVCPCSWTPTGLRTDALFAVNDVRAFGIGALACTSVCMALMHGMYGVKCNTNAYNCLV